MCRSDICMWLDVKMIDFVITLFKALFDDVNVGITSKMVIHPTLTLLIYITNSRFLIVAQKKICSDKND